MKHYKLITEKAEDFSTELNKWIDKGYKVCGDLQTCYFLDNANLKSSHIKYSILISIEYEK